MNLEEYFEDTILSMIVILIFNEKEIYKMAETFTENNYFHSYIQ